MSNLERSTSRLEQGWNHENTFVPFLGMSVFFIVSEIENLK
ncbi:hypothetical protein bthur0012_18170 [Bacillus thuringiensis serovar pulsiensis BGSC 4CC1]|nr:hypothetical protein bthur0012_18170 [Bacillus thuringiensis serovar pulsiensis BGSC 4CC1]